MEKAAVPVDSAAAAALVVLLREDGAALMQLRDDKQGLRHAATWVFPGGHLEPGETSEVCARREFCEETSYRCTDDLHPLGTCLDAPPGHRPHWLAVFWAAYDGKQQVTCHEGQALRFLERAGAEAYPIPPFLFDFWDRAIAAHQERLPRVTTEGNQ